MNAATNTTTSQAGVIAQFWDKKMLTFLEANTYFYQLAEKRPLPEHSGGTINFNRYSVLPALTTALTEGTVPTSQTLTDTKISATVAQYGGYVSVSDLLTVEAINDVQASAMKVLQYQAALSIDTIIRNNLDTNATIRYAGGATSLATTSSTDVLNGAELRAVVNTLDRANVKPLKGSDYVMVCHPQSIFDLESDTTVGGWLQSTQYVDNDPILNGQVHKMYGVRLLKSTNIFSESNGAATPNNVYFNMILGEEGLAVSELAGQNLQTFVKPAGSAGSADPINQVNTVGWKTTFAPITLDPIRVIADVCGSSI